MAKLSHPNVVAVYDVGSVGDEVFLAMELVDGGTLADWARERRPWREVLAVMRRAGEGLAAAHAAGIVHRDFKPENVLVGRDGRVRVTDFGLARAVGGSPGARRERRRGRRVEPDGGAHADRHARGDSGLHAAGGARRAGRRRAIRRLQLLRHALRAPVRRAPVRRGDARRARREHRGGACPAASDGRARPQVAAPRGAARSRCAPREQAPEHARAARRAGGILGAHPSARARARGAGRRRVRRRCLDPGEPPRRAGRRRRPGADGRSAPHRRDRSAGAAVGGSGGAPRLRARPSGDARRNVRRIRLRARRRAGSLAGSSAPALRDARVLAATDRGPRAPRQGRRGAFDPRRARPRRPARRAGVDAERSGGLGRVRPAGRRGAGALPDGRRDRVLRGIRAHARRRSPRGRRPPRSRDPAGPRVRRRVPARGGRARVLRRRRGRSRRCRRMRRARPRGDALPDGARVPGRGGGKLRPRRGGRAQDQGARSDLRHGLRDARRRRVCARQAAGRRARAAPRERGADAFDGATPRRRDTRVRARRALGGFRRSAEAGRGDRRGGRRVAGSSPASAPGHPRGRGVARGGFTSGRSAGRPRLPAPRGRVGAGARNPTTSRSCATRAPSSGPQSAREALSRRRSWRTAATRGSEAGSRGCRRATAPTSGCTVTPGPYGSARTPRRRSPGSPSSVACRDSRLSRSATPSWGGRSSWPDGSPTPSRCSVGRRDRASPWVSRSITRSPSCCCARRWPRRPIPRRGRRHATRAASS